MQAGRVCGKSDEAPDAVQNSVHQALPFASLSLNAIKVCSRGT
jgi:hypothetical protein